MSLSERVVERARIMRPTEAKVCTLDIERAQGSFRIENYRGHMTIEGKFWDLGDLRHFLGRRLRPDEVTEWPRTICVAYRWYGQRKVEFHAEWDEGGREGMLQAAWEAYDEADIIVGHNIANFDTKKLKGEWAMLGLPTPRPYKHVDTLTIARREFGMESNQLGSLCERFGVATKVDKYDVECARAALAGDKTQQRRMKRYNVGDIVATEEFYDALRGKIPNHPFMGSHGDVRVCNQCGGTALTLQPTLARAVSLDYPLYRCDNCGGNVADRRSVARAAGTKGVR